MVRSCQACSLSLSLERLTYVPSDWRLASWSEAKSEAKRLGREVFEEEDMLYHLRINNMYCNFVSHPTHLIVAAGLAPSTVQRSCSS